jgi:hypothetical protein
MVHLGGGTAAAYERISLRDNASRSKVGQYHKQTYSHHMRITNLQPDIMWLIGEKGCGLHQVKVLAPVDDWAI